MKLTLKSNIHNSFVWIEDIKLLILYKESFIIDYDLIATDILERGRIQTNLLNYPLTEQVYKSNIVIVMFENELGNTIQMVVKNRYA